MRRLASLAVLLALAGCGSTVQLGVGAPSAVVDGLGSPLSSSPDQGASEAGAAVGGQGSRASSASLPPASPGEVGANLGAAQDPGTPGSSVASPITLKGITPTTVSVGISWTDTAAVNAAVSGTGASDSKAGDMLAEQRAIAKWMNAHGGIAGRKIALVEHQNNINDDSSTAAQKMCANWTEDHHVVAGLGVYAASTAVTGVACLAKHKTLAIGSSYDVGSQRHFDMFRPYYYAPASMEMAAVGKSYAQGLVTQGFFTKKAKIGVLVYDSPEFHDGVTNGLSPALKAAGLSITDLTWIQPPSALSDEGRLVANIQSAALKYRSDGITHVLFLDGNSSITYFFIQQAKSQGYRPSYGFSSLSYPSFVDSNFNADDLRGSLGVGWQPTQDVDVPYLPANPARSLCQTIMKESGQQAVAQTDLTVQLIFCSQFFLLKQALEKAPSLSPEGFLAGVAALGRTNATAAAGTIDSYSASKLWGSSDYRFLRYVEACSCFQYYGPARPI